MKVCDGAPWVYFYIHTLGCCCAFFIVTTSNNKSNGIIVVTTKRLSQSSYNSVSSDTMVPFDSPLAQHHNLYIYQNTTFFSCFSPPTFPFSGYISIVKTAEGNSAKWNTTLETVFNSSVKLVLDLYNRLKAMLSSNQNTTFFGGSLPATHIPVAWIYFNSKYDNTM